MPWYLPVAVGSYGKILILNTYMQFYNRTFEVILARVHTTTTTSYQCQFVGCWDISTNEGSNGPSMYNWPEGHEGTHVAGNNECATQLHIALIGTQLGFLHNN